MATKQPAKKRPKKAPAKKRAGKAPAKKRATKATAKKRPSKAPAKKRRSSLAPEKVNRPTKPAGPRAKKASGEEQATPTQGDLGAKPATMESRPAASAGVSPVVPPPQAERAPAPSRVASYLESVPQDRAELFSGLFQVARGAAKDLRTLFTQALAISHKKTDPYDR